LAFWTSRETERREPHARSALMAFHTPLRREGRGEGLAEPVIPIIQRAFDFDVALRLTVTQVVGGGRARGSGWK